MKPLVALLLFLGMVCPPALLAAVRGKEVMYVGGTIRTVPEGTEGELDTKDEQALIFNSPKGSFSIPYGQITSLEYGQKAGRRVGATIGAVATLGLGTLPMLLSKKRKHFLTIGFKDAEGKPQGVVLEVPKGTAKTTITIIEARSGQKVEYESEEARKHVHG